MHDDEPTITLLDALNAELADYWRKRYEARARLIVDQPEYAVRVDAMWQYAISALQAKIEREEQRHAPTV